MLNAVWFEMGTGWKMSRLASLDWQFAPTPLPPLAGTVQLWRVAIASVSATERQRCWDCLAPEERQRAQRFIRPVDQERFVVSRGLLRHLLGRYAGLAPTDLQFAYNAYGKPSLQTPVPGETLCFNLSHAAGWVVYAIAPMPIGIDLEQMHPVHHRRKIVERFFSPQEQATFVGLTETEAIAQFFQYWTAKEAYTKAIGQGITLPLEQVDVALTPTPHFRQLPRQATAEDWQLRLFAVAAGYVGAIALPNTISTLLSWQWEGGRGEG